MLSEVGLWLDLGNPPETILWRLPDLRVKLLNRSLSGSFPTGFFLPCFCLGGLAFFAMTSFSFELLVDDDSTSEQLQRKRLIDCLSGCPFGPVDAAGNGQQVRRRAERTGPTSFVPAPASDKPMVIL